MASKDYFNGVIDAIIDKLNDNKILLGNFVEISERDEEPSVIADSNVLLPKLVVMPLSNRSDTIRMTSGGSELHHAFTISIMGYYRYDSLDTDIRTMRSYAFDCFDLFRVDKIAGQGHIYGGSINPGYFIIVDNPIYKWVVTLNVKMYEP